MAAEARDIIAFQKQQIGQSEKPTAQLQLDVLRMLRAVVDYAEKIGALPASLPQFSRATALTPQAETKTLPPATVETPVFDVAPYEQIMNRLRITPEQFAQRARHMVIGGRNSYELEKFIEGKSNVGDRARSMVRNRNEFTTLPQPEGRWSITLSNAELGLDDWVTTNQLLGTKDDVDNQGNPAPFTKGIGQGLGLELCLPEVGVYQRAADQKQPLGAYWMAMKPITDSGGFPSVFEFGRSLDGFWLYARWADPGGRWYPQRRLVWALPASLPQFSRATELTQAITETQADTLSPRDRIMAGLGLTPEQLAQHPDQITPDTKAYVGDLVHTDSQGSSSQFLKN